MDPDAFVLFFLFMYSNQYQALELRHKIKWWFSVIFIFIIQLFCLIILSTAYLQQYASAGWSLWSNRNDNRLNALSSTYYINVSCVIVAIMVLLSYLTKSISHQTQLFCACLNLTKQKSDDKLLFSYGIIISTLNLLLIVSTWSISLIVILYGEKFELDNVVDVVFTSVGNVFILEIDDYFCDYFRNTFDFTPKSWSVEVRKSKFKKSFWYHNQFFVLSLVIWAIIWSMVSEEVYRNFAWANLGRPVGGSGTTVVYIQVSFIGYLACIGFIGWKHGGKRLLSRMYLFACFMNIVQYLMISFVAHDGIQGWVGDNGFAWVSCDQTEPRYLQSGAPIYYCAISHPLMGIAVVLYVLIVWSEMVKDSKLQKYSNRLFWLFEITSLISLCIWRFQSPYYNEGWYAIGYGYGAAYIKYYGETVFGV